MGGVERAGVERAGAAGEVGRAEVAMVAAAKEVEVRWWW